MNEKHVVVISSPILDLEDYREKVMDACHRVGAEPKMMEHLPALNTDAVETSLEMVDDADIYLGIFAHRYGSIAEGYDVSITELEYQRAVEKGKPRLIFLVDEEVPVAPKYFDTGDSAAKLQKLKKRLATEQVVAFFQNPNDLRGLVIQSLNELQKQLEEQAGEAETEVEKAARQIHYVSAIPAKPEPYIAHPYTLLQVRGLIGRKQELEMLTDWITKADYKDVTIFNIIAIGGMGKSALTWTWFNDIAPQEKEFAGRIWWSFYESDASFENFVFRTLAYVSGTSLEELKKRKMSFADQQQALLNILDKEPYLIVFDGIERILIAYARHDAAYLNDDTALDDEASNWVAGAYGLPQSAGKSFVGRHRLRKTADVRVGHFLRKLARIRNTRVLVSSRLYPADLQVHNGRPYPGCFALFLLGLSDQDALDLWRAYGAKGARERMLPVFHSFDKHPLLLQLLAYEVAEFRDAPGDFDAWQKSNPNFSPFHLPLVQVQSHVLKYALRGLSAEELRTLHVIAGFRMPAGMETVKALLIASEGDEKIENQPFTSLETLDKALSSLEDRGLLGWDRKANRYDLHPIVRGVVWTGLKDSERTDIYGSLRSHFEAMPMHDDYMKVESVEDLGPAIELYHTLIGLRLFDEASEVFRDRLSRATLYRLSASRLRVELLERLFPDGIGSLPALSKASSQSYILNALAQGYELSGQVGAAFPFYELADEIDIQEENQKGQGIGLSNLSAAFRLSGNLYKAEISARKALIISRDLKDEFDEAASLDWLGLALAYRGIYNDPKIILKRSLQITKKMKDQQGEGIVNEYLAEHSLLEDSSPQAKIYADRAWELASASGFEIDFISSARLQGIAALRLNDLETAEERLYHALTRARAVQLVEEELPTLTTLAELHRQQQNLAKARERLEEVWESAERGPYPIFHADALNVLAQIEIDEGNQAEAIDAATEAYKKAWCDGPPYAYHAGLEKAKQLLKELGAPEPEMPPFDASKFEPMPEVEIAPPEKEEGE